MGKVFLWDSEHRTNAPNGIIYLKLTPFVSRHPEVHQDFCLMSANSLIDTLQSRGWYIALRNINRYIFHNEWLQQLPHSCYENRYKHVDSEDSQEAPNKRISFRNSRKCESRSRHCQQQSASFSFVFLFGSFVQSFDVRKLVMWYHGMMWIVILPVVPHEAVAEVSRIGNV